MAEAVLDGGQGGCLRVRKTKVCLDGFNVIAFRQAPQTSPDSGRRSLLQQHTTVIILEDEHVDRLVADFRRRPG